MNAHSPVPVRTRREWLVRFAITAGLVLVVLGIAGSYLLQPQRASALLLDRVGASLGLRITASGAASYRLRGTPQLVLHDVVVQKPGDASVLLRAKRIFISVPWTTIRARGAQLTAQRVELDAPILDVPALQRWLASRPPSETIIPTLTNGLRIVDGRIDNGTSTIDGITLELPALAPGKPLHARLQGRYLDLPITLPFDLDVDMTKPANGAGLAVLGKLTLQGDDWKLPMQVYLVGPLHSGDDGLRMSPAKLGLSARYVSTNSSLPFVLGAAGPLHFNKGVWAMDPVALVLRGQGVIPDAKAKGALALGRRLVLRLHGAIAAWPDAWRALPPPLSESTSAMPFTLDYQGPLDFSEVASLELRRDATTFDARFKLPVVVGWVESGVAGSPLPPLAGHLKSPRIEIAGATLEGVEVEFQDDPDLSTPALPAPTRP